MRRHILLLPVFLSIGVLSVQALPWEATTRCEGTLCPSGCCPKPHYVCCANGLDCAPNESQCNSKSSPTVQIRQAEKIPCEGTICPAGCCPEPNYECCPNGKDCAPTIEQCEPNLKLAKRAEEVSEEKAAAGAPCTGTVCPAGCCPEPNYVCCPNGKDCAKTEELCSSKVATLQTHKTDAPCLGTICPSGCCPEAGWFCCADGLSCAVQEADCDEFRLLEPQDRSLRAKDCQGTSCPGGCCSQKDWVCCDNPMYCAPSDTSCPAKDSRAKILSFVSTNAAV